MIVNTYPDVEELAKQTVLYAINNIKSEDAFFEKQGTDSIFYKVYNDLCEKNSIVVGSYFALHLEKKYEIKISIR